MPVPLTVTYLDSTAPVYDVANLAVETGSLTAPATMADGDFLLGVVRLRNSVTQALTLPTGWFQEAAAAGTGSFSPIAYYFVWHRVVTASSEPTSYTFSWTGVARFGGIIHRYSGVAGGTGTPWAGSTAAYSFASGGVIPSVSYTSTTAGQGIWAYQNLQASYGIIAPSSYTKRSTLNPSGAGSHTVADRPEQPGNLTTGVGSASGSDGQVVFAGTLLPAHVNVAPTAVAGANQTVEPWSEVFLDGSGSSDPEGIASYVWTQTSGPTMQMYGFGARQSFYAPGLISGATINFQLAVTDTNAAVSTSSLTISVAPPTLAQAKAGTWQPVRDIYLGLEQPNLVSPAISTLTSAFNDLAGFSSSGSDAAVTAGQLQINATPGFPLITSDKAYDLTGSSIYAQLVQPPNVGNGSVSTSLSLFDSTGNQLDIGWANAAIFCNQISGGVTNGFTGTFTSGVDKYLRIRHDGTNIVWETSTDKTTWTVRRTAAPAIPVTRLHVLLRAGNFNAEPTPGVAIWDNLNL